MNGRRRLQEAPPDGFPAVAQSTSTDADLALAQRVSLAPMWVHFAVTDGETRGYVRGYAQGYEDRTAGIDAEAAEVIGQMVRDQSLVWTNDGPRRRDGWSAA